MYLVSWYDIYTELETTLAVGILQFLVVLRGGNNKVWGEMTTKEKLQGPDLDDAHYAALAGFRRALRQVMADSEQICAVSGLTTQRFQALLAIRTAQGETMSIGALAEELLLKHHSAVELAGRLEQAGLVHRRADPEDKRRVLLTLTDSGRACLSELTRAHGLSLGRSRNLIVRNLKALPGAE